MSGTFRFELIPGWEQLPAGYTHGNVQAIDIDSHGRVHLLVRRQERVIVYEPSGAFVKSWGEGAFTPFVHGMKIGPDDSVYIADIGDHTVRKFSSEGRQRMVLGTPGKPSDTGYKREKAFTKEGFSSIARSGPPFNSPANVTIAPNGEIYVTDGYGNARVHRFTADGKLIQSWGEPGTGPGQFILPHGICFTPDGRLMVTERENDRIQIFTPDGEYLDQWTHVQRPADIRIDREGLVYVSSLGWRVGEYSFRSGPIRHDLPGHISILDLKGNVLLRWGISADRTAPGNFASPHGICVDSQGDLYVGEVAYTNAVQFGVVPADCHTFQKFARKGSPPKAFSNK